MKLRIQNDSVRLRLTVGEVERIARGERVAGRTRFPGDVAFVYVLAPGGVRVMDAILEPHQLTVRLPSAEAFAWATDPERIALRGRVDLAHGDKLDLLVEKDFACLVPRVGDSTADLFVNPAARKKPAR